jgi:hypothetical protein
MIRQIGKAFSRKITLAKELIAKACQFETPRFRKKPARHAPRR